MNQFGTIYVYHVTQTLYTVAPLGTVICKRIGTTSWIPACLTKEEFEESIAAGDLVKR